MHLTAFKDAAYTRTQVIKAGKMAGPIRAPTQIGDWVADPQTDTISRGGSTQKLEPRTMRLLLLLAETPGAVLSVEQMLNEVWQGVVVSSASVYQAISQLRRLLGDTDPEPTYIATVPRKGYRLVAPVVPIALPAPPPAARAPSGSAAGPAADAPVVARRRTSLRFAMIATAVAALSVLVWTTWHRYFSTPSVTAQSIVVLPFVDMTEKREDQFFCDGLTEELSNWLAQIPTLRVVARTSAFAFRDQRDARQIGRELNTTHVLEGSLRRFGDHVRITAQLIDARTGYHVWSSEYDREQQDTIKVQEDIARAVAESLQIHLTQDTTQKFAQRRSTNSQAYETYLLAKHYQQDRTRESNLRAIDLYQQALAADPNFALAYVGLAYANLNQLWLDSRELPEVSAAAEPLLEVAERLDPQLSELYAVRGALREEQARNDDAQRDLLRAVALNPNDNLAYAELGRLALIEGRPRDALPNLTRALALDPLDFTLHARQCIALQDLARYAEAGAACARSRALQAEGNFGTIASSWLEWSQGHLPEALQWNALAIRVAPANLSLYELRADLFLALGLPSAAKQAYEEALAATANEEETNLGMSWVVYYEGGPEALRAHLASTRLDQSEHSRILIQDAYLHVLAQDPSGGKALIVRAMSAGDLNAARLNDPWYVRWGDADLLGVAACELQAGERDAALSHLQQLAGVIDRLLAAGEQRFQIYELQAEVLALRGDDDRAMQALSKAAALGWRRAWWAEHEPFFAHLRTRGDFRSLVERVEATNRELRAQTRPPN
jgi:TolB-like protein/DNA-binding winged helix-turn-helix (wHTH) protein